jgi:hypothetical protein
VIGDVRSPQFTMRLKAAPAATTVAARSCPEFEVR